jgi:hypothetical protein
LLALAEEINPLGLTIPDKVLALAGEAIEITRLIGRRF